MLLFENRSEWLESLPSNIIFAEIGVLHGDFSMQIYEKCKPKKLFLIDCWQPQSGEYEKDIANDLYLDENNEIFDKVCKRFSGKKEIEIIRAFSQDACKYFDKDFFDVVYIDANHTFDAVWQDLNAWWPLVRPGGYLSGHDYYTDVRTSFDVFGAVNQFLNQKSIELSGIIFDTSWIIRKTK